MNKNFRPLTEPATNRTITIRQAVESSEALGVLARVVKESGDYLKDVSALIPEPMRASVVAGPIDNKVWCLLVSGNAAAAKLRQLSPLLLACLSEKGRAVEKIRLKILPKNTA